MFGDDYVNSNTIVKIHVFNRVREEPRPELGMLTTSRVIVLTPIHC